VVGGFERVLEPDPLVGLAYLVASSLVVVIEVVSFMVVEVPFIGVGFDRLLACCFVSVRSFHLSCYIILGLVSWVFVGC